MEALFAQREVHDRRAMKESVRALASLGTVDEVLAKLLESIRVTVESTSATLLLCEGDVFRLWSDRNTRRAERAGARDRCSARWLIEQPVWFVRAERTRIGYAPKQFKTVDAELRAFGGEVAMPSAIGATRSACSSSAPSQIGTPSSKRISISLRW